MVRSIIKSVVIPVTKKEPSTFRYVTFTEQGVRQEFEAHDKERFQYFQTFNNLKKIQESTQRETNKAEKILSTIPRKTSSSFTFPGTSKTIKSSKTNLEYTRVSNLVSRLRKARSEAESNFRNFTTNNPGSPPQAVKPRTNLEIEIEQAIKRNREINPIENIVETPPLRPENQIIAPVQENIQVPYTRGGSQIRTPFKRAGFDTQDKKSFDLNKLILAIVEAVGVRMLIA